MGKWAIRISKKRGHDWVQGTENQDADAWDGWGVRNGDLEIVVAIGQTTSTMGCLHRNMIQILAS